MSDASKLNRTWLCSVLFLDIVNYSSQSVDLQLRWKERFNRYLAESIKDVPEDERVILDTGDGAAVCFLGAPEVAMFSALDLWHAMLLDEKDQQPPFRTRIGINLGPVKLVRDINGRPNALGDGINAGQRIMSFAGENQILVSQSYFEVVSRLSDDYKNLFTLKGVEKDKHIREHTVYHLSPPGAQHVFAGSESSAETPPAEAAPQVQAPARPVQAVPSVPAPAAAPAARQNRMMPLLLGVAAVLLIGVAGAVWHFSNSTTSSSTNTPPASSTPPSVSQSKPVQIAAPAAPASASPSAVPAAATPLATATPTATPAAPRPVAVSQQVPVTKAAVDPTPVPVAAKPAPISTPPPAVAAPALSAADQATARDLRERYNNDVGRAATARGNADEMRQRLAAKGMALNAQTAASVDRLQVLLNEAAEEIRNRQWDDALSSLQAVEATADKINKTVGN